MTTQEELNRLFWNSRRGMLELDVLLVPFSKEVYPSLEKENQEKYQELLACEDADLFVWFMGKEKPENSRIADMVSMVIKCASDLSSVH